VGYTDVPVRWEGVPLDAMVRQLTGLWGGLVLGALPWVPFSYELREFFALLFS
jgi:hypothetical protein